MGYEYKILAKFTEKQAKDILTLLEKNDLFDKKYYLNNQEFRDFRRSENKAEMPDLFLIFELDGIYICQNSSSYIWQGLEGLKKYIETEKIDYEILDHSE